MVNEMLVSSLNEHAAKEPVWCEVKSREEKNFVLGSVYRTLFITKC